MLYKMYVALNSSRIGHLGPDAAHANDDLILGWQRILEQINPCIRPYVVVVQQTRPEGT